MRGAALHFLDHGDWDRALLHLDQTTDALTHIRGTARSGVAALIAVRRGDRATAERHITAVADIPYLSGVAFLLAAQYLTRGESVAGRGRR